MHAPGANETPGAESCDEPGDALRDGLGERVR